MEELYIKLDNYNVSPHTGFIPERGSQRLPEYYMRWEDLNAQLPLYLKQPRERAAQVDRLPLLTTKHLLTEADYQRAYVLLSFIIHAYVHGCEQKLVPLSVSGPFLAVSAQLGLKPVISYASLCTYNWSEPALDRAPSNFRVVSSFTGTIDEAAFYLTPVLVERTAGPLIAVLLQALIKARDRAWDAVVSALYTCAMTIKQMIADLEHQKITDPEFFYTIIRPNIAGLKNICFERETAESLKVDLAGGSAVQSPSHQALDKLLGVQHKTDLLMDMRAYMPGKHRDFLNKLDQLPSLIDLSRMGDAPKNVWQGLDECRMLLKEWRDKHISIVTRYIVLPSKKVAKNAGSNGHAVQGTAGSSPVLFLKEVRNETARVLPEQKAANAQDE